MVFQVGLRLARPLNLLPDGNYSLIGATMLRLDYITFNSFATRVSTAFAKSTNDNIDNTVQ